MRRWNASIRGIVALGLGLLFALAMPGCSGGFSSGQVLQAFKFGGAPGGQSEPEPVFEDVTSSKKNDEFSNW